MPHLPKLDGIREYLIAEKYIGQAEREILVSKYGYHDFQTVRTWLPNICCTDLNCRYLVQPLPCQAWQDYMITSAHRVGVEVGADVHASAPPSGAAAATPSAGAPFYGHPCARVLTFMQLFLAVAPRSHTPRHATRLQPIASCAT
jgi:hypothetical protein